MLHAVPRGELPLELPARMPAEAGAEYVGDGGNVLIAKLVGTGRTARSVPLYHLR